MQRLHCKQPAQQREEKGRSGLRNGIAYGRLCHLLPKWALWLEATSSDQLDRRIPLWEVLEKLFYVFLCVRWLKKRKVATTHKTHNLLLFRHISQRDNINCALYQLGSWSQGALVTDRSNPLLIIGKLLSWEAGLEDGFCQTSPVFTPIFYIACVCEGL